MNCYLKVETGAPIIGWQFDDKDMFDVIGNKTQFLKVSREGEYIEHYVLFKELGVENDYYIRILERQGDVLIKVVFDDLEENVLVGRCKKNQDFDQFVKAYHDENKGNITLEITTSATKVKKLFYTFAFLKNEFSTLKEYKVEN